VGFIIRKHANSQLYRLKQVAAIAVLLGFFDDPLCSYIASACLYLNSRHNTVTSQTNL
jgi:hypothetical protein